MLELQLCNLELLLQLRHFVGKLFEFGVRRGFTRDSNNDVRAQVRELEAAVSSAEDREINPFGLCDCDVAQQVILGSLKGSAEGLVQCSYSLVALIPRRGSTLTEGNQIGGFDGHVDTE